MKQNAALTGLNPLTDLLTDVLSRLEALEASVGTTGRPSIKAPAKGESSRRLSVSQHGPPAPGKMSSAAAGEVPVVKAWDAYVKESVVPFTETCDSLGGLDTIGDDIKSAWEGIRFVIVLASRAKAPSEDLGTALAPHIKGTQDAVKAIRAAKVDRDFDRHYKAICEMLGCLSWVFQKAPQQLPAPYVKETLGSAEFWSNRIRKDYKGKDEKQIEFCDRLKQVILGLEKYIHEYHKTGLAFNPRGVSMAEAVILLTDQPAELQSPKTKRPLALGATSAGGNIAGIMGELSKRKNADGSSAATGLKKVTKDMQTWRKEFNKDGTEKVTPKVVPPPSLDKSTHKKDVGKKKLKGIPIFEYQDRGFKWVIENHTKESVVREASENGVITVEITDPKQQVYMFNCDGITVKVNGKFKSLVLDKCEKCSVVYETLISSAEVVNSKKIQLQVTGVCPVFTIDKTINVLVWLSAESKAVSTFTTSLSSELNVSFPEGEDQKEVPIPEQFVHKITNGALTSDVSDLYH